MANIFYNIGNKQKALEILAKHSEDELEKLQKIADQLYPAFEKVSLSSFESKELEHYKIGISYLYYNEFFHGERLKKMMTACFNEGIKNISEQRFTYAFSLFKELVRTQIYDYDFVDAEDKSAIFIKNEDFTELLNMTKNIADAWVTAKACEYADLELPLSKFFKSERGNEAIWPSRAVHFLHFFGEPDDLIPIEVVGNSCYEGAMEGYTREACRGILAKVPVTTYYALPNHKSIDASTKPEIEIVFVTALIELLGLDLIMNRFLGMNSLKTANASPIEPMVEAERLEELIRKGYECEVKNYCGYSNDVETYFRWAKEYMKKAGIIKNEKMKDFMTEYGWDLIRGICHIVPYINADYDDSEYPLYTINISKPQNHERLSLDSGENLFLP